MELRTQGAGSYRAAMHADRPIQVDERSWRVIEWVLCLAALAAAVLLNGR